MAKRWLWAIGVALLAACNYPEPTEIPTCTADQLQAPQDLSPNGESVVLDPSTYLYLNWGYPATSCEPDFFEAYVWTGVEPDTPGMTGRVDYEDAASPGAWSLPWGIPLQPGNTYYWRVYAGLETGPGPDVSGPSARGYFFTGPICTDPAAMQPVDLLHPIDDAVVALADDVTFAWDDPTPCLVDGLFELQISANADFATYLRRIPILQTVYTLAAEEIPLAECTRFYWRVKTDPAGPLEEPFSEAWSFFVNSPGILCPIGGTLPPMATARLDLNCRAGPSSRYRIDDTFFAGASAPVEGRNADGSWLQILSPNLNILCWIWAEQADVEGPIEAVAVVEVAPPPEEAPASPEPVNCGQYTDYQACQANAACEWRIPPGSNFGSCVNR